MERMEEMRRMNMQVVGDSIEQKDSLECLLSGLAVPEEEGID